MGIKKFHLELTSSSTGTIVYVLDTCISVTNESTAGADASVEVPKLHNIKLLYTHIDYNYHDEHL